MPRLPAISPPFPPKVILQWLRRLLWSSPRSSARPAHRRRRRIGLPPVGFFDPLRLSADGDVANFKRRRAVELQGQPGTTKYAVREQRGARVAASTVLYIRFLFKYF